jgi:hypothetical protein
MTPLKYMDDPNDLILKKAVDQYLASLLHDLPAEKDLSESQVLSSRFQKRMKRMIRKVRRMHQDQPEKKINYRNKKRLVIVVAIVTVLAAAFTVNASREAIVGFVIQVYDRFSTISFRHSAETTSTNHTIDNDEVITDHLPTYLPQGYKLSDQSSLIEVIEIIYTNESSQEIVFTKIVKKGTRIDIDTEGIQIEEVTINGYQGIFYSKNGQSSLIWSYEKYAYSIIGKITKEEMINMDISTK